MNRFNRASIFVLGLLTSITCGSASEVVKVSISDLAFVPAYIKARVGDTIEWTNSDFIDHTATDRGGSWDVTIIAGKSERLLLGTAGTFHYFCRFHPDMIGTINVDPASSK